MSKLQAALPLTPEQVAQMPPTQVRIRELENEVARLRAELAQARQELDSYRYPAASNHGGHGAGGGGGYGNGSSGGYGGGGGGHGAGGHGPPHIYPGPHGERPHPPPPPPPPPRYGSASGQTSANGGQAGVDGMYTFSSGSGSGAGSMSLVGSLGGMSTGLGGMGGAEDREVKPGFSPSPSSVSGPPQGFGMGPHGQKRRRYTDDSSDIVPQSPALNGLSHGGHHHPPSFGPPPGKHPHQHQSIPPLSVPVPQSSSGLGSAHPNHSATPGSAHPGHSVSTSTPTPSTASTTNGASFTNGPMYGGNMNESAANGGGAGKVNGSGAGTGGGGGGGASSTSGSSASTPPHFGMSSNGGGNGNNNGNPSPKSSVGLPPVESTRPTSTTGGGGGPLTATGPGPLPPLGSGLMGSGGMGGGRQLPPPVPTHHHSYQHGGYGGMAGAYGSGSYGGPGGGGAGAGSGGQGQAYEAIKTEDDYANVSKFNLRSSLCLSQARECWILIILLHSSRLSLHIRMEICIHNIRSPLQEALGSYLHSRCSAARQARTIHIAHITLIAHISCMLLIRSNLSSSSSSSHTPTLMDIRQAIARLMDMTAGLHRKGVPDSFRIADRTRVRGLHHIRASGWALALGQEGEEEAHSQAMPEVQTTVERCALDVCYVLILHCTVC